MGRRRLDNPTSGLTISVTAFERDTYLQLFAEVSKKYRDIQTRTDFFRWLMADKLQQQCREFQVPTPEEREQTTRLAPRTSSPVASAYAVPAVAYSPPASVSRPALPPVSGVVQTISPNGMSFGIQPPADMPFFPVEDIPNRLSDHGARRPPRALLEYHRLKQLEENTFFNEHVWPKLSQEQQRIVKSAKLDELQARFPVPEDYDPSSYRE